MGAQDPAHDLVGKGLWEWRMETGRSRLYGRNCRQHPTQAAGLRPRKCKQEDLTHGSSPEDISLAKPAEVMRLMVDSWYRKKCWHIATKWFWNGTNPILLNKRMVIKHICITMFYL